jgi:hypothetical protein
MHLESRLIKRSPRKWFKQKYSHMQVRVATWMHYPLLQAPIFRLSMLRLSWLHLSWLRPKKTPIRWSICPGGSHRIRWVDWFYAKGVRTMMLGMFLIFKKGSCESTNCAPQLLTIWWHGKSLYAHICSDITHFPHPHPHSPNHTISTTMPIAITQPQPIITTWHVDMPLLLPWHCYVRHLLPPS